MIYNLSQAAPSVEFEGQVVVPTMTGERIEVGFYDHFEACNTILEEGGQDTIALLNSANSAVSSYGYLFNMAILSFARYHEEIVEEDDGTDVFNVTIDCSRGDTVTITLALPDGEGLASKLHTMTDTYTKEQIQGALTTKKNTVEVVI